MSSGWVQKVQIKKNRQLLSLSSGKRSWKQCLTCQRRAARRSIYSSRAQRRSRLVKSERNTRSWAHSKTGKARSPTRSRTCSSQWYRPRCLGSRRSLQHQCHRSLGTSRRARVKLVARYYKLQERTTWSSTRKWRRRNEVCEVMFVLSILISLFKKTLNMIHTINNISFP